MFSLFKPNQTLRYRTLVVEFDEYWLTAAIMCTDGVRTVIESKSVSNNGDPQVALSEALTGLDTKRMPKSAILLIPGAVQTIAHAPADGDLASSHEAKELIQLELEARLSEQIGARPFEEIAVERGYLTYDDVEQIRGQMKKVGDASDAAGRIHSLVDFAETALSLNLMDRPAVQECQMVEDRFRFEQMNNAEIDWMAEPLPPTPARPQATWLASGLSCMLRDQWIAAFTEHSIELAAIYPIAGNAAAIVDDIDRVPNAAIVEVHAGMIAVAKTARGHLTGHELRYQAGDAPTATSILDLADGAVDAIWLAGGYRELNELCDTLNDELSIDVRIVPVHGIQDNSDPNNSNTFRYAHLVGAYRHWNGLTSSLLTGCIRTEEIAQTSRKRNWIPAIATVVAIATALGAAGIYQGLRLQWAQEAVSESAQHLRKLKAGESSVDALTEQVAALKQQIQIVDRHLANIERRRKFVLNDMPRRGEIPLVLLNAVVNTVTPEVAVDDIEDQQWTTIRVAGWALSQVAAERFADALSRELRPWQLELAETPAIQQKPGRLGLDGYRFELRFGFVNVDDKQNDLSKDHVALRNTHFGAEHKRIIDK